MPKPPKSVCVFNSPSKQNFAPTQHTPSRGACHLIGVDRERRFEVGSSFCVIFVKLQALLPRNRRTIAIQSCLLVLVFDLPVGYGAGGDDQRQDVPLEDAVARRLVLLKRHQFFGGQNVPYTNFVLEYISM